MTRYTILTRTALYRLALQRFGPDAQALKLTEEAAELAASAARNLNGQGSESDLAAKAGRRGNHDRAVAPSGDGPAD